MKLLVAVLVGVACPYALLRGIFIDGSTVIILCLAYYSMARFCRVGQAFVSQASTAEGLLRDLAVKSHILSFNVKVCVHLCVLCCVVTQPCREKYMVALKSCIFKP
ncbi:uncharacterized protein LOC126988222 [Eriocheir sinensis]|uniref:uncharacterized protein LOC126988222 n=1 Tax=Eriocheir sinensis TaxID=95602 RepID=UPI0021CA84C2|nr:uncharacterized protein LOC126988222 [Eriocheir sinensis]